MRFIDVKRTDKTPEVILDTEKRLFLIKGNCLPENIRDFSTEVINKYEQFLRQYTPSGYHDEPSDAFRVHFRMGYFNSAAAKFIADVMIISGNYIQKGYNIRIYWYFEEDDHDMLEAGEEISQMVSVPMEFVTVVKD
jgi:hypothetical protein